MTNSEPKAPGEYAKEETFKAVHDLMAEAAFRLPALKEDIASTRNNPDIKAEYARYVEYMNVDLAVVMATQDDVLEHAQRDDREMVLHRMVLLTGYIMNMAHEDPKRLSQLTIRLVRLLYMELVAKYGSRERLMEEVAAKGDALAGVFAPDLMTDFEVFDGQ